MRLSSLVSVLCKTMCLISLQVYLFAEALAEGAVKMGMPSALAHSIASQTVLVSFTVGVFSLQHHQQFKCDLGQLHTVRF